jgi:predicted nucleotidyltransferase
METTLSKIVNILKRGLGNTPCTIFLFGSRVRGEQNPASDFDIAVDSTGEISASLSLLREELENSNIPQKVDLVDLKQTSEEFRSVILREGVIIWRT